MPVEICIRKIENSDSDFVYQSLCKLENEILDLETFEEIFFENITNPNYYYLIAENEKDKLGFISFHTQKLLHHSGVVGEIQEFYVNATSRNQGVGRKLIAAIRNYAQLNNLQSVEVTTNKKRTENVAIYQNLGFTLSHNKFTIIKKQKSD